MDVVTAASPYVHSLFLDVSVRHPLAAAYVVRAAEAAGVAAVEAERAKAIRYPPGPGLVCTPCVLETGGRQGPALRRLLRRLAALPVVTRSTPWAARVAAAAAERRWSARLSVALGLGLFEAYSSLMGADGLDGGLEAEGAP